MRNPFHFSHHGPHQGFIGRHRGDRHGFGRFVASFNADGLGGDGFSRARKLNSSELQLLLLALLKEQPRHGYELIKTLDEKSGGFYNPSPGMIYPALTYLEEAGQTAFTVDGTKKRYHLTTEGDAYLERHRASADAILAQLGRIGQRMEHVRRAFAGDAIDGEELAGDPRIGRELHRARRELKSALIERRDAGIEQQLRIAEILRRATEQIRGTDPGRATPKPEPRQ